MRKFFSVSCAVLLYLLIHTPSLAAQAQTAEITGIAHLSVRSSDLDREVAFLGKLGFEQAFANVTDGKTTEAFIKVNDRQFIEVYPRTDSVQPLGLMHVCYEAAALNALNGLFLRHGLKPTALRKAGAGNLLFSLYDPEGRELEFTQYMPGSRHILDRGKHLGAGRVSDQILGLDAPVRDIEGAKKFYSELGFDEEKEGKSVRLKIPSDPDLAILLHPALAKDGPVFLLAVQDAGRTEDLLKAAGLKPERRDKVVYVRDPDGNLFELTESLKATLHRGINVIPWRRKSGD